MMPLSHTDDDGKARMVGISEKDVTKRIAIASGTVRMNDEAFEALRANKVRKGDVLATANIAGISAAKRTSELIPLCHPIDITGIELRFELQGDNREVKISSEVVAVDRTGAEMEALMAVSVAALTIYDMCKSIDRSMIIGPVRLISKSGGKSGDFLNE